MKRQHYKIMLVSVNLAAIVYILCFSWWAWDQNRLDKSGLAPSSYDVTITNYNKEYTTSFSNSIQPYELPYLKIKNISFSTDQEYLYIKYKLAGVLPKINKQLPVYDNDQIAAIFYKLYLDENYFDLQGKKNPGGPEAELKINLYGGQLEAGDNRISVDGELLKGGPGFDYFVVRYPYYQLLLNQVGDSIVFSSYAIATSARYPAGATIFEFENPLLAADPANAKEVKIDLSIKPRTAETEENMRY